MKRIKKTGAVLLAATFALILFSLIPSTLEAQTLPYYVDIWEGTGTGSVTWDETTFYPWQIWNIHDYFPYPSGTDNVFEDESGWTCIVSFDGSIAGEVNVYTYAGSGTWDTDYPSECDVHGTWLGTFNRSTEEAYGIWYYYNDSNQLVYGGTFSGDLIRTETRY